MSKEERNEADETENTERDDGELYERKDNIEVKSEDEKELKEILEEKEERIQELESLVKRVKADFENYKKDRKKEEEKIKQKSRQDLLKRFLDLFDGLRSATDLDILKDSDEALKDHKRDEIRSIARGLYEGIENVLSQFEVILKEEGIEIIEPEEKKFDPELHEAIDTRESEVKENNKIAEVLQVGYRAPNRVIRPARVIVYKNTSENNSEDSEEKIQE